jgi:hypothetical protein
MPPLSAIALAALVATGESPPAIESLAGKYYRGDGLGVNWSLQLNTNGTYAFTWDGCLGRYAESQGHYRLSGQVVVLEAEASATPAGQLDLPSRLVGVGWGSRQYLIQEDRGPEFVAAITRGFEPRRQLHGQFLLRRSDVSQPARGAPAMPEEWRKWLLPAAVEARVTKVLARHRATVDAGANRALHAGMLLTLTSQKYGPSDIRVVEVLRASSVVENDYGDPPFVLGGRVTSRPW